MRMFKSWTSARAPSSSEHCVSWNAICVYLYVTPWTNQRHKKERKEKLTKKKETVRLFGVSSERRATRRDAISVTKHPGACMYIYIFLYTYRYRYNWLCLSLDSCSSWTFFYSLAKHDGVLFFGCATGPTKQHLRFSILLVIVFFLAKKIKRRRPSDLLDWLLNYSSVEEVSAGVARRLANVTTGVGTWSGWRRDASNNIPSRKYENGGRPKRYIRSMSSWSWWLTFRPAVSLFLGPLLACSATRDLIRR